MSYDFIQHENNKYMVNLESGTTYDPIPTALWLFALAHNKRNAQCRTEILNYINHGVLDYSKPVFRAVFGDLIWRDSTRAERRKAFLDHKKWFTSNPSRQHREGVNAWRKIGSPQFKAHVRGFTLKEVMEIFPPEVIFTD